MDEYQTITTDVGEGLYSEKRSRFIAYAYHVETVDEVKVHVAELRSKYYDARHCCYAYMLGPERTTFRANDDGEPSSTGGKPILGQINSRGLTDVLVCVVRYYGGVNLGTGRLMQAYKTAAAEALDHCTVETRTVEATVEFAFPYRMMSAVMRVARDAGARVAGQEFGEDCKVRLAIRQSGADVLSRRVTEVLAMG